MTSSFYNAIEKRCYLPVFGGDIVKLAVSLDSSVKSYLSDFSPCESSGINKLIEFQQKQPLSAIIADLCDFWKLDNPDNYGLQLTTHESRKEAFKYVTENNRNQLANGAVLLLTISPTVICKHSLEKLITQKDDTNQVQQALKNLSICCHDEAIVEDFIKIGGLEVLTKMIENSDLSRLAPETSLYLLSTFWQLMDLGRQQRSWNEISNQLIHEIVQFVIDGTKILKTVGISCALTIIEAIINSSKFHLINRDAIFGSLPILLLKSTDYQVQHSALAVLNAIYAQTEMANRESIDSFFSSEAVRGAITSNVLNGKTHNVVGAELAHQLHVLQRNVLNKYETRMKLVQLISAQDAEKLNDLRRATFETSLDTLAFSSPSSNKKSTNHQGREFKRLGFKNPLSPVDDLKNTPSALLALDCMLYFASQHHQSFNKFLLENSCRTDHNKECPFAQASFRLTKLIVQFCKIGEPPSEEGNEIHEFFFTTDSPLEQFFSVCIVLLNRTWKEMKADAREDMENVIKAVSEQINRSFQSAKHRTFQSFESATRSFPYSEIAKIWDRELVAKEENEFSLPAIIELKQLLRPKVINLIRTNRFKLLKKGQQFPKYARGIKVVREKSKFWYWQLSVAEKSLLYCDCTENTLPDKKDMKNAIYIEDIGELLMGNECPHVKELNRSKHKINNGDFTFSILLKNSSIDDCFNFVVSDQQTFDIWTDGLNFLMNRTDVLSKRALEDAEMLLNLDIKMRLMALEESGVHFLAIEPIDLNGLAQAPPI